MPVLSQEQSYGALLGDYLQPVVPAGFVWGFFSVRAAQTASQKSEEMLLLSPLGLQPSWE